MIKDTQTARLAGMGKIAGIAPKRDLPKQPACYKCRFVKRLNATGREGVSASRRYFCQRWSKKLTTTNEVLEWEWCEHFNPKTKTPGRKGRAN